MKTNIQKRIIRIVKITGISIFMLIGLLFLAPFFFPQTISNKIKDLAKDRIQGEMNFTKARFSFFSHFPSLTLDLHELLLKGSAPFQKDTLVAAEKISLGVDLRSLFSSTVRVNQIYLTKGLINIQVDEKGEANYNVYKAPATPEKNTSDTGSASLKLEKIVIESSRFVYNDRSLPMYIAAGGFEYVGNGDFSKSIFDLTSAIKVKAIDFAYNNQKYFVSKTISADLVTQINTESLAFQFQKNNLYINQLPFDFTGRFAFLKDGYDMDFKVNSNATELKNLFTAFPPEYLQWLDKTEVLGTVNFKAALSGQYIAATGKMPDFGMSMEIRKGSISNAKTPLPLSNLFLNFETRLPGFNTDSLYVNVDSIYATVGKDYISAICLLRGLSTPEIHAKINGELDLEKWQKAIGLPGLQAKGQFSIHGMADGIFIRSQDPKKIRPDTIISSIPSFDLKASFRNGYFKYPTLPKAVDKVRFDLLAACKGSDYQKATLQINNINANLGNNYLKGFFNISGANDFPLELNVKGLLHLADIKSFYPLDSIDLKGDLVMDLQSKGKYNQAKKIFPVTNAVFSMQDGFIQTKYYPHPIENIKVDASLVAKGPSTKDVVFTIKPIGFEFEGQPFTLTAGLKNLENIKYDIRSNGTIDIGKIYQVFARKGLDVKGWIKTDIDLHGTQADASSGHYERLSNKGTMVFKDIVANTEFYPFPFHIKSGTFRFKDDKIWLEQFTGNYQATDFVLNGYMNNIINYALHDDLLQGQLDLKSKLFVAEDWMAYAGDANSSSAETGVFMVPNNLDLTFKAGINKVTYSGMVLTNAKGQMQLNKGIMRLKETGFTMIGAPVIMDASYQSLSPKRALFDYHINAKDFDIKKAYNEVKIFHDMATAAASAEGIVSLDYTLKGKLDANMHPVYPSLEGGGVLSLKAVKLKGFKMFSAAGKEAGKDSLNGKGDISKVDLKTSIKNNIITLEQTKIRSSGFRLRLSGQASFDGALNMKMRIGLPPLGIFGIPLTITGTQENPIIKMNRGKNNQPLQEKGETEEEN